ncbi:V-type ATP synthase subunit A [Cryobacterium sp. Hz7]|uniref:V-type ATP synthase alpha chain n=1 Tax=Cryobacterium sandaracinum TaxID=1259247 RepID=A0ABY2JDE3_9MICO|nr:MULTISPECIES: V-type ATP synthase subunit A [Cryobacterium]TFB65524.1 V-type ATP synthase subunit A [Cryobacterium sp. Hz7]TFD03171.1 V-type ATP synthase subunit A [Cryobacterium sandaracinum]
MNTQTLTDAGTLWRVAGPVAEAIGLHARLYDVVLVGTAQLPGEVIRIDGKRCVIQVYEDTAGLAVGEPVVNTGQPLQVELGPGLLGQILDGTQRPLRELARRGDDPYAVATIARGARATALDRERRWDFSPAVREGDQVGPGDLLGTVPDAAMAHRVLVPPRVSGIVRNLRTGLLRVSEPVATVGDEEVAMLQYWPVRQARPASQRLALEVPLVTGQRVIDTLFPIARGGAAAIPGGFGTGKTVLEQSLAKWSTADVVIYIGCGERGNELAEVLEEFPALVDPRTGTSLMQRTVLIANTSNMPVAAREASIYTGITIAEFFRDQGLHVALMADSTSRWGEALREVSSRLEEMPAEEGYPAYLATRLAEFYERAGAVRCLGDENRTGSVTVIGAVSPAGGDFSEPITQHSLRLAGTFWALDTALARRRHFPSINWTRSYTLYQLDGWFADEVSADWPVLRAWALDMLQRETSLLEIVQLLGADALAAPQRVVLTIGRLLREDFLQQSAFDEGDASCSLAKQHTMLTAIHAAHDALATAVERGVAPDTASAVPTLLEIGRMRAWPEAEMAQLSNDLTARIRTQLEELR